MNTNKELQQEVDHQAKWARRTIRYSIVSVAAITAVIAAASLEILIFKGALIVLAVFGFIPIMFEEEPKDPNYKPNPYSKLIGVVGCIACATILYLMS